MVMRNTSGGKSFRVRSTISSANNSQCEDIEDA